jgi:hypothetical protein
VTGVDLYPSPPSQSPPRKSRLLVTAENHWNGVIDAFETPLGMRWALVGLSITNDGNMSTMTIWLLPVSG